MIYLSNISFPFSFNYFSLLILPPFTFMSVVGVGVAVGACMCVSNSGEQYTGIKSFLQVNLYIKKKLLNNLFLFLLITF